MACAIGLSRASWVSLETTSPRKRVPIASLGDRTWRFAYAYVAVRATAFDAPRLLRGMLCKPLIFTTDQRHAIPNAKIPKKVSSHLFPSRTNTCMPNLMSSPQQFAARTSVSNLSFHGETRTINSKNSPQANPSPHSHPSHPPRYKP